MVFSGWVMVVAKADSTWMNGEGQGNVFSEKFSTTQLRIVMNRVRYLLPRRDFRVRHNTKQTKGFNMQTSMNRVHDPARARAYFEDKLAFTTGPVELDRWIRASEDNLV